tara:strand:- start:1499 stop:2410 length:912 start_codon:yes stop_codon:yes gene_type:complete
MEQNKLFYIVKNTSGKVRDKLCIEDIYIPNEEIAIGFGLITVEEINEEKVLWFKEPVRIPKFNKFYASRINSVSDPYLFELIKRIVYLNPLPDFLMVKKITEFIVLRFSRMVNAESEVKLGEYLYKPVLTFEEIEPIVKAYTSSRGAKDYEPDNEVPILFERNSKFTREEKISILAEYRGYLVKDKLESVIHTAAEHLIDKQEYLKVTNSKIQETGIVETHRGKASIKTISKYIAPRTKKIIGDHNEVAYFATQNAFDKYKQFLELEENLTLDEMASKLQASKSTIIEFKELKNKVSITNINI